MSVSSLPPLFVCLSLCVATWCNARRWRPHVCRSHIEEFISAPVKHVSCLPIREMRAWTREIGDRKKKKSEKKKRRSQRASRWCAGYRCRACRFARFKSSDFLKTRELYPRLDFQSAATARVLAFVVLYLPPSLPPFLFLLPEFRITESSRVSDRRRGKCVFPWIPDGVPSRHVDASLVTLYVAYRTRERAHSEPVCVCVAASTKIEQIDGVFSKTRIVSLPLLLTHRFTYTPLHFCLPLVPPVRHPFRHSLTATRARMFPSPFCTRVWSSDPASRNDKYCESTSSDPFLVASVFQDFIYRVTWKMQSGSRDALKILREI